MTDQHPITIPPDLEEELLGLWPQESLQRAARWGWQQRDASVADELQEARDEELEECCEWIANNSLHHAESDLLNDLRAARRPKPKSLAEEGYDALDTYIYGNPDSGDKERTYNAIRRALERLQELERQSDG